VSPLTPQGPDAGLVNSPTDAGPGSGSGGLGTLDLLMDMRMPILIRFGTSKMLLRDVLALAEGSVVEFGRAPEDPVDVLVNGRVVARGIVVTVQGNYGVQITEIASSRDNVASGAITAVTNERSDN
jgi:flagellar motor switch protein FliN